MIYLRPLPRIDNIRWLARLAEPYPTTRQAILEIAETWNFSENTLSFLQLFSPEEEFTSRSDFLMRCAQLEMLIREERKMPAETLRSPQE